MILSIRMQNIALIASLTIEFDRGMYVMTGETGAGKSIVVDAVNLVLGGRSDRDLIRTGTDKAWVEAEFDPEGSEQVARFFREHELEADGSTVTLYREISRSGRNLCRICGVTVPVAVLRELAGLLMDVHGQHETRFLSEPAYQLSFLDGFGDEEHRALLARTAAAAQEFMDCHQRYGRLLKENQQKQYRMEQLEKGLKELHQAQLKPGEEEELRAEKDRFRFAEKITGGLETAKRSLTAAEDGESVLVRVRDAVTALQGLTGFGSEYAAMASRCESAYYELEEMIYDLSARLEDGDFDPRRAEFVETRLDLIRRLERKYGSTVTEVLKTQNDMEEEFDHFASMDQQIEAMSQEHKRLLGIYRRYARQLTENRTALAAVFEKRLMEQLAELGMEKTVFRVSFLQPTDGRSKMPTLTGDDIVDFLISPNPGEPMKPMTKIASGGELSRIMLAMKTLEADHGGVGTMVFDEIDTGISGHMAQVVGEKMSAISRNRQVICVTHLPQIAAMADHQLLVTKLQETDRTNTTVRILDEDGRVADVARMLGGASGSDESALDHARKMREAAEKSKSVRK